MKILLSPAKIMSLETNSEWDKRTKPDYIKKSIELHSVLQQYSPSELERLLDISPKLSKENWERIQVWKANPAEKESLQALLAFKGEVYRGLNAESLSEPSLNYLEENLLILSGLYGILHPSTEIMPYRLEMGKKIKTANSENLYEFWSKILSENLISSLAKDEPVLNLTSKEYFKVLKLKEIKNPIISVDFKDYKNGKLTSIIVYFKNARGRMTRWCAENNIQTPEDLKTYNEEGYEFSEKLSKENNLVFIR